MTRKPVKPMIVGLTGGVATGKTAVARCFESLGVPVIDTDQLAREVVRPGTSALKELVAEFGDAILGPEGELDRRRMRDAVFADEGARRRLEAIIHPRIAQRLDDGIARVTADYCVVAIPLLVEAGWTGRVDRIVVVDAPEEMQVQRLMDRDGLDADDARAMLRAQASREDRLRVADDVIDNTGDLEGLHSLVERLHAALKSVAAKGA